MLPMQRPDQTAQTAKHVLRALSDFPMEQAAAAIPLFEKREDVELRARDLDVNAEDQRDHIVTVDLRGQLYRELTPDAQLVGYSVPRAFAGVVFITFSKLVRKDAKESEQTWDTRETQQTQQTPGNTRDEPNNPMYGRKPNA